MAIYKFGTKVRIKNSGRIYSTYDAYVRDHFALAYDRWRAGKYRAVEKHERLNGTRGKIVLYVPRDGICFMEDEDGDICMIGSDGLEIINEQV